MRPLIVAALFLAACGGGASPAQPAATGAATAAGATQAAAATGVTQTAQASAQPGFSDVVTKGKIAVYKITYKIGGTGATAAGGSSEMSMYFKPPKTRIDIGSGGEVFSLFYLENGTFACTSAGGQKMCFQTSEDAADGQAIGFDLQESFRDDPAAFNATFSESRTIAGTSALCYVVKGGALGGADGTFCYTATGVPLLSQWSAGGATWSMEATAFSTAVTDADFTLPAPPTKLP